LLVVRYALTTLLAAFFSGVLVFLWVVEWDLISVKGLLLVSSSATITAHYTIATAVAPAIITSSSHPATISSASKPTTVAPSTPVRLRFIIIERRYMMCDFTHQGFRLLDL